MGDRGTDDRLTPILTDEQRLLLHQLRLLEWLAANVPEEPASAEGDKPPAVPKIANLSEPWRLTPGITLSQWQVECRDAWFAHGRRGTVKVVTGAGKTILALAIAEKLHNEYCPELRVAVVVPTIVLMNQWYDEIVGKSNLPVSAVGRLGGGFQDSFAEDRRFLLAVLDSAQSKLPKMVQEQGLGDRLLLVADECHRAGAPLMSRVLTTPRAFSLGLSATPERDDLGADNEATSGYGESLLGKELGDVIYELTLARALELGIVPRYSIRHYGLQLTRKERGRYESLSRTISDTRSELQERAPANAARGGGFFRWVQRVSQRGSSDLGSLAARFLSATSERKDLLYRAEARFEAVRRLLDQEFRENPETMAILFHENIEAVNELFLRLREAGFPAVLEHSKLPQELRNAGLDLFRRGIARVIVSAKSLIEGFNVPAVDVGIIVASSTSVRQRIQSMGRVLRRHRAASGEEKTPVVHILYVRGTTDELIYAREDWARVTGAERNEYYQWLPPEEPERQPGPPRECLPTDTEVDVSRLKPGDIYPGRLEGDVYSCDTQGNIRDAEGRFVANAGPVYKAVRKVLGRAGRFYVTPRKHYCLVRVPEGDDWVTRFVMALDGPLRPEQEIDSPDIDYQIWLRTAKPGVRYPFRPAPPVEELQFRQKRGGVIAKKIRGGEVFALVGAEASDPDKGRDAETLLAAWSELRKRGELVTRLELNSRLDAVYRKEGELRFLAHLIKGLEFPD